MKKYIIKNARFGEEEGGIACGPVGGAFIAEIEVEKDNGDAFFLSFADFGGIPGFYKTEKSYFGAMIANDDEKTADLPNYALPIDEYEQIFDNPNDEYFNLYRYLIYLFESDNSVAETFIADTINKGIDDITVPATSREKEYNKTSRELEECFVP